MTDADVGPEDTGTADEGSEDILGHVEAAENLDGPGCHVQCGDASPTPR
ncbi:hypothetical protein [Mycobacteroides abscessus]|nr:hypothetical protein [Mycobacteroides abscessus]MBN7440072.1 hypothetical protein [Mycobacteroides abscessus subsp. abscessus]